MADEVPPPTGWQFSVTPYAWLVGVSGKITARGQSVNVDADFYDILTKSDYIIPLMAYLEARNGRFSIFGDLFYTEMKFSKSDVRDYSARRPKVEASLAVKGKAGVTQTLAFAEAGAAYEIARRENGPMGSTGLEILGGARYWYASTDATLKIKSTLDLPRLGLQKKGKYAVAKSGDVDWVDPVVGMRVKQDFGGGRELQLLGDIGGFGVGSQFSWQVYAGYSHTFPVGKAMMAWNLGYRALAFDYETGSGDNAKTFDMVLHGPIAGLTVRW